MRDFFRVVHTFVRENAKVIELVCIIISLVVISFQSIQMNENLEEVKKSFSLELNNMLHSHKQKINEFLILEQSDDLRRVFELDREALLYYIMINDYSNMFTLNKKGILTKTEWKQAMDIMVAQMADRPCLYEFWISKKEFFNQEFVMFIEPVIANRRRQQFTGVSMEERKCNRNWALQEY